MTPAMGLRPDGAAGAGRSGKAPASYSDRSLAEQSAASRGAAELVRIQYREGGVDFLVLPNAERTPLVADDTLCVAGISVNTDVVATYKARGRGWKPASA
ncbi:hypothetical protein ACN2C7_05915 [Caulobacter sp. ErkDOM-E]|uniref:hypothetical protein n=1 Tax=Caulobacter sp. ErkDOM-E TaxID=3402778 RepID=UPI003AF9BA0D